NPQTRSQQAQSYVNFVNCTQRKVDVCWYNYQGKCRKVKTLKPGEQLHVSTRVKHPWVFRDSETRAAFVIDSEEVFFPKPCLQEGQKVYGEVSPRHIPAFICLPLYSLKERAAQVVSSQLSNPKEADDLDIAKTLKETVTKWLVREHHLC
ncbi:von Hippel-Lindau disease tumor suppressor-like, partial [Homarus americanus]|uniref:von Hippel-Lindau disease tumor suppressor-like n=1 Tax=Homarus americanus TaxID=6706 RepID=UPI001C43D7B7